MRITADCLIAVDPDLALPLASLGEVVAALRPHQSLHVSAKCLVETDRHLGRGRRLLVREARQCHPADAKRSGRRSNGEAQRLDDDGAREAPRMNGFLQARTIGPGAYRR